MNLKVKPSGLKMLRVLDFAEVRARGYLRSVHHLMTTFLMICVWYRLPVQRRRHELAVLLQKRRAMESQGVPPILRKLRRRTTSHKRRKGRLGVKMRGKLVRMAR